MYFPANGKHTFGYSTNSWELSATSSYQGTNGLKTCARGGGAPLCSRPSRERMNKPKQLSNGWYAETCLNEKQVDRSLYLLAQRIGISSERDYEWQAENGPRRTHRDVDTLKKSLIALRAPKHRLET